MRSDHSVSFYDAATTLTSLPICHTTVMLKLLNIMYHTEHHTLRIELDLTLLLSPNSPLRPRTQHALIRTTFSFHRDPSSAPACLASLVDEDHGLAFGFGRGAVDELSRSSTSRHGPELAWNGHDAGAPEFTGLGHDKGRLTPGRSRHELRRFSTGSPDTEGDFD